MGNIRHWTSVVLRPEVPWAEQHACIGAEPGWIVISGYSLDADRGAHTTRRPHRHVSHAGQGPRRDRSREPQRPELRVDLSACRLQQENPSFRAQPSVLAVAFALQIGLCCTATHAKLARSS